jgi:hypothetical protein
MYESIEKELAVTVEKARINGYWFHSKYSEDWITPEEFEMLAKVSRISNGQNDRSILDNYHMADPRNEIRNRMAKAAKLTADLQEFSEKVFAYFNQVAKDRK